VVSGFIFLRFFTPAIICPNAYGIVEGIFLFFTSSLRKNDGKRFLNKNYIKEKKKRKEMDLQQEM
jgi:hypothetical protein